MEIPKKQTCGKNDNIDRLFYFFSKEFPFNKEGLEEFINSFIVKSYKKGEIILESGNIENELRFLEQGIVREYYRTDFKEKNLNFYTNSGFITDFSSFTNNLISNKNQDCLTNVELKVMSREKFLQFIKKYTCGRLFIETIFQRIVINNENDKYTHFSKTPEELYIDIVKNKPNWLLQIPQYHIASYLGITPETLSRIRQRI